MSVRNKTLTKHSYAFLPMTYRSSIETIAIRLSLNSDLRQSLKSIAQQEAITAGIILSGIGSLSTVCLRFADQKTHTTIDAKHEILTLAGTLSTAGIHLHMSVANSQGVVIGGHVVDGCIIYTTAEIVIGILPDLQFDRSPDPQTGFLELSIEPNHKIATIDC
jgi:uncharacterized protein